MAVTGASKVIIAANAPANVPAQPIPAPSPDLLFNMAKARPGVPGIINPDNTLLRYRDWDFNFRHATEGFAGVRWCPSWIRTDSHLAEWEPAHAHIYRIQRKGTSGVNLQTLVLTCSPNTAAIPAGDSVVIWDASASVPVVQNTSHDLAGYALPTRAKLTVTACTPSVLFDEAGRRIIEVATGTDLPAIDFSPAWFAGENGQESTMQLRHWSFYKNAATKELRYPLKAFADITLNRAIPGGGYVMLGGNRWATSAYDWSKDYLNFGAALTGELFRLECEGLAATFGAVDPRRLAAELEDRVVHGWASVDTVPGYRTLLADVWYPIARTAWGQERTLVVKGPGGIDGLLAGFDWPCPTKQNVHLAAQATDAGVTGPGGPLTFATIADTDWLADQISAKIASLGYAGGGLTSFGVVPPQDAVTKAKKIGRLLTSMNNHGLYAWLYANLGTDPATTYSVADIFTIGGSRIEALYPEMRAFARRAGLIFA